MTTKEVAEKLGISVSALNQNISGNPSVKVLATIANVVGVPVWKLFIDPEEIASASQQNAIRCPHCGKVITLTVGSE